MEEPLPAPPRRTSHRQVWQVVGIVLAVLAAVYGLMTIGLMLVVGAIFSGYGSNK
jgi:hypothetical protein